MINFQKYDFIDKVAKIKLYEKIAYIRMVSEAVLESALKLEIQCPLHFSIGQEAASAGIGMNLLKSDFITTTHRSHAPYLAKGGDLSQMISEFYGKNTGSVGGYGGSMHLGSCENNIFCSAIVGGGISIAVGAGLAFKMKNKKNVSVAFFGDGASEEGVLHESLNFASLRKLPVIFFCENNFYAVQSSQYNTHANPKIYEQAISYGMPGIRIDGNNILEVYEATGKAIANARKGKGPFLIEAVTYRWREHVGPNFDFDMGYRSKEELEKWMKRCPVDNYEKYLLENKIIDVIRIKKIKQKIEKQIKDAWKKMERAQYAKLNELI